MPDPSSESKLGIQHHPLPLPDIHPPVLLAADVGGTTCPYRTDPHRDASGAGRGPAPLPQVRLRRLSRPSGRSAGDHITSEAGDVVVPGQGRRDVCRPRCPDGRFISANLPWPIRA